MVANSHISTRAGRKSTGKTANLTPEQALEILQQSIINCQHAGIEIHVAPLDDNEVVIVLANVALNEGKFII